MSVFSLSEYLVQSDRLSTAAKGLLSATRTPHANVDRLADEVVAAAELDAALETAMAFTPQAETAPPPALPDILASVLFDVQAANVLISAGLALEGPDRQTGSGYLDQSVRQIEQTHAEIESLPAFVFGFNAQELVHSGNLEEAISTFRKRSHATLDSFVAGTQQVVQMVLNQLRSMDPGKVLEAISQLGGSFDAVRNVGNLLRRGVEKLKAAQQALIQLLGEDAVNHVKPELLEMWQKVEQGTYTHDALVWIFGIQPIEAQIEAILAAPGLGLTALDAATNALLPLADSFAKNMKLVKNLLSAVIAAAGLLALLHIVLPWLPLLTAGAYVALLGAAVLIGRNYSGSSTLLHWVEGVGEIAGGIGAAPKAKQTAG